MKTPFRFFFLWFIALNLFSLLSLQAAQAEEPYRFERMWPQLKQPWYFVLPEAIAVGSDGLVYLVETTKNHRIHVFTLEGAFIRGWGNDVPGDAKIQFSYAIAIDSSGRVYLADTDNHQILVYTAKGKIIGSLGSKGSEPGRFNQPSGITISPSGQVFVADAGNHRIQVFTAAGEFVRSWGVEGAGDGELKFPNGVTTSPSGQVYVTDAGNHRIQVFTAEGEFVRNWGTEGTGEGEFKLLTDISIGPNNLVYTVDAVNDRIQVFSDTGEFVNGWKNKGVLKPDSGLKLNLGISVSHLGYVYVVDKVNHRVQVFTDQGKLVHAWKSYASRKGGFFAPRGIVSSASDSIFVADTLNHRIQVFNAEDEFVRFWGMKGTDNGKFNLPTDINISPDGNIYVVDALNNRIQVFTVAGEFIRSWGKKGDAEGEFNFPSQMGISSSGLVFVTDRDNHRIQVFTAEGEFVRTWGNRGADQEELRKPDGIAISADNLVYVADSDNNRIQVYTVEGLFVRSWGSEGSREGQFKSPGGMTLDSNGQIYVADRNNHRIQVFSSEGQFVESIGAFGSNGGQLNIPYGMTLNSSNNLFIADTANNRIQRFVRPIKTQTAHPYKAVLLAGGGPSTDIYSNLIWDETLLLTNKAHQVLRSQGFQKDEVKYLTAGSLDVDLDGNGELDDLESASLSSLEQAITDWATDASDVVIYLIDHGGPGSFQVNDHEILTDTQLSDWVDQLDNSISGKVTVIIESCKSGSFLNSSLAQQQRILISSADAEQPAIISNGGLNSFSHFFWGEISGGANLQEAFKIGRQGMSTQIVDGRPQDAQLESNGDLQFDSADFVDLADFCIGNCTKYASNAPTIISVSEAKILNGESSTLLIMQINSLENILQAWVTVIPPDFHHPDSNEPVSELSKIPLNCDATLKCTTNYQDLGVMGDYQFTFYAQNDEYQMALPQTVTITQTQGTSGDKSMTAEYDEQTGIALIYDVLYENIHYQVELIHPPGDFTFSIKSAQELDGQLLENPAQLDIATATLTLNKVSIAGKFYTVVLKEIGNFIFQLDSVQELSGT